MNLAASIELYAIGGPGSGCHGPNCGRPPKADVNDAVNKGTDYFRSAAEWADMNGSAAFLVTPDGHVHDRYYGRNYDHPYIMKDIVESKKYKAQFPQKIGDKTWEDYERRIPDLLLAGGARAGLLGKDPESWKSSPSGEADPYYHGQREVYIQIANAKAIELAIDIIRKSPAENARVEFGVELNARRPTPMKDRWNEAGTKSEVLRKLEGRLQ